MLVFSLINIIFLKDQLISLSVGFSAIGIIGFILFILKINLYKPLFLIWVIVQFPILEIHEIENGFKNITPVFNLSQGFHIKFGINFTYNSSAFTIGPNILSIGFYFLYKLSMAESLISRFVTILPVTEISPIAKLTPLKAKIIDITDKGSFIAILEEMIEMENLEYKKLFFKTVDKSIFRLNKTRQKCSIKFVSTNKEREIKTEGFIK